MDKLTSGLDPGTGPGGGSPVAGTGRSTGGYGRALRDGSGTCGRVEDDISATHAGRGPPKAPPGRPGGAMAAGHGYPDAAADQSITIIDALPGEV